MTDMDKEEMAAALLDEGLSAVSKRRNAYVQGEIDGIVNEICQTYGVNIKVVYR